jgi:hypothetical protein
MKERIDNWHKSRSPSATPAQANLLEVVPAQQPALSISDISSTSPMPYLTSYVSQDEAELATLEAVALATMKHQEEVCKRIGGTGKSKNVPVAPKRSPELSQSSPANSPPQQNPQMSPSSKSTPNHAPMPSSTSQQPQYRFSSAVEDPWAIKNVIE